MDLNMLSKPLCRSEKLLWYRWLAADSLLGVIGVRGSDFLSGLGEAGGFELRGTGPSFNLSEGFLDFGNHGLVLAKESLDPQREWRLSLSSESKASETEVIRK